MAGFWKLVMTFSVIVSLFFSLYSGTPHDAKMPEDVEVAFNVAADAHVETNNYKPYEIFAKSIADMKEYQSTDANVFLGDNTMNGQDRENYYFFGALNTTLDKENTFVALGNHDLGNGEGDYNDLLNNFKKHYNRRLNNDIDKPYYYRVVNDYYMIFLAPEKLCVNTFYMSDEQIQWFKDTLALANESGKPIFVFSHHPLTYIENENTNVLVDIMKEYKNIFHMHGHTHEAFEIYDTEGIVCVNLPRISENGEGVVVEVYDSEVIFRQRNFAKGTWLNETSIAIEK